jgi:hypothetical protein
MIAAMASWHWSPNYATAFLYLAAFSLPLVAIDLYMELGSEEYPTQRSAFGWQLTAATAVILIIAFGAAYEPAPFVYFQF